MKDIDDSLKWMASDDSCFRGHCDINSVKLDFQTDLDATVLTSPKLGFVQSPMQMTVFPRLGDAMKKSKILLNGSALHRKLNVYLG